MTKDCDALGARIEALSKLLDEREERTKDRFLAMDKMVSTAFAASEKAIEKADVSNQRHFTQLNEFRASLEDQTRKYLEKEVYGVQHEALAKRMDLISSRQLEMEKQAAALLATSAAHGRVVQWGLAIATPIVAFAVYLLGRN